MARRRYITISVPVEVKELLERGKGDLDWGEYLTLLYREYEYNRRLRAFNRLRSLLSESELDVVEEEFREFRRRFRFR